MIFLFTRSNKLGSRLIQWGLDTDVAHMALLDSNDPQPLDLVLESRLNTGVDVTWLKSLREHSEVVTALKPEQDIAGAYKIVADSIGGNDYDWRGVSYLAASVLICMKLLGRRLPRVNKWGDPNDYFCSEILTSLGPELLDRGVDLLKYEEGMLTPERAREILVDSGGFTDVTYLFKDIFKDAL